MSKFDIWHDDEGVWLQLEGQTYGPFYSEEEAELAAEKKEKP